MSETNLFGKIVTPDQVEEALAATISRFINDYLGEIERIRGYEPGSIERPRGVVTSSEFHRWPEDQVPVILVVNAGLVAQPARHAQGSYDAAWTVGVAPVVSDVDDPATRKLSMAYTTAVRVLVGQHKMLKSDMHPDGFAQFSMWAGETYDEIPALSSRSLMAGRTVFAIGVESVMTEQAGPRAPSEAPLVDPGGWPTVEDIAAAEDLVPITGSVT